MALDFKTYLSAQVIAEKQTVSYRNVARALKVHVNAAKCMLYEFYSKESGKRPGSVYATYLIAGKKHRPVLQEHKNGVNGNAAGHDEETPVSSSPPLHFTSSMIEPSQQNDTLGRIVSFVPTKTITLVREEALEEAKQQYETITSLHMYSVSPGRIEDLVALTEIGRGLFNNFFLQEDPLSHNKTYGVIQNPDVRRRTGKRPLLKDIPTAIFQPTRPAASTGKAEASAKTNTTPAHEDSRPSSRDSTSTTSSKPAALKRDSSNLFKAFAKHLTKPKLDRKDTDVSNDASGAEDLRMTDADDDEGESEDEALFLDTNTRKASSKKRSSDAKKEREDKAAKLRKMMDSDDEDVDASKDAKANDPGDVKRNSPRNVKTAEAEDHAADGEEVEWSDSDNGRDSKPGSQQQDKPASAASSGPRRRRGKRKVIKKRTMKDEDGYLVTKEEPVWESFSEDEPEPGPGSGSAIVKSKATANVASKKSDNPDEQQGSSDGPATAATAKGGGKKKADIMSFFGKK